MKAVSRWLDTLLVIDLLAHFLQLQHAVQVIRSCKCNAFMCMHLGNHSASLEVHNPHLETSDASVYQPDLTTGGLEGGLGSYDFSAGHLNQINDIKSGSTILNLIQIFV